ncbi:MAG: hypothetical protein JW754_00860 [Candidatus Aenigmarchaeota archaeon]|nr:hypothetical protein [Candidatus Aenigmarchaeota archaeon]
MPRVVEIKTTKTNKHGIRKEYSKKVIFLPKVVVQLLNLEKGDNVEFRIDIDKIKDGVFEMQKTGKIG